MWSKLQHKSWYWTVALLSIAVCIVALGGGLFGQEGIWLDHWQHKSFRGLCHQNFERSFILNGTPMAVCSRCIGIFSSFTFAWLLFPITGVLLKKIEGYLLHFLMLAIFLNLIDMVGNILGFWQNTLTSRYVLGTILGGSTVLILGRQFIINKKNGMNHGTNRDE